VQYKQASGKSAVTTATQQQVEALRKANRLQSAAPGPEGRQVMAKKVGQVNEKTGKVETGKVRRVKEVEWPVTHVTTRRSASRATCGADPNAAHHAQA
jgi:hypothetical protein